MTKSVVVLALLLTLVAPSQGWCKANNDYPVHISPSASEHCTIYEKSGLPTDACAFEVSVATAIEYCNGIEN